jgi:Outer membrane protein beta-barrel domain
MRRMMKLRTAVLSIATLLLLAMRGPAFADDGSFAPSVMGNGGDWAARGGQSAGQPGYLSDGMSAAPMPPNPQPNSNGSPSRDFAVLSANDGATGPPAPLPPDALQPGQVFAAPPAECAVPGAAANVPQPTSDISIEAQPPPPTDDSGGEPGRQHPLLDRFRRFFGPEPNGNWDNEPVHFDTFLGFLDDRTAQNTGVFGGFRLGWDYDTYWGVETRLGFTSLQEDTGPTDVWDESLLYYPWGDSRVRPYFTLGVGITEFHIVETGDWHARENLVDVPFGLGFKYRIHEWLALRFDVLDNLAFGSHNLGTMNNFSFTSGFEWRFGGGHYNYWPWNPGPGR